VIIFSHQSRATTHVALNVSGGLLRLCGCGRISITRPPESMRIYWLHVRPESVACLTGHNSSEPMGWPSSSISVITVSAEIRLPDARQSQLLCPFQYFGITDSVGPDRGRLGAVGDIAIEDLEAK